MILCLRALTALLCCLFIPALSYSQALPELIPYREGNRWGYTDTAGHIRIRPQWSNCGLFHGNRAIVTMPGEERNVIFCLIDTSGNYVIPPKRHLNGAYGRLNSCNVRGQWGMIDSAGALMLSYAYDAPVNLQFYGHGQSLIPISRKSLLGIADASGKVLIPPQYKVIEPAYDTARRIAFFLVQKEKGQWAVIGENYQEQAMPACDSIWIADSNGWLGFTQNGRKGMVHKDGRIAVPAAYEEVVPMDKKHGFTYFRIKAAGLYGVADEKGLLMIPARYRQPPSQYTDGNFHVIETHGKDILTTVISPQGKILLSAAKGEVLVYSDSVVLVHYLNLIDSGGQKYQRALVQQLDPLTYAFRGQPNIFTRKTVFNFSAPEPAFCGTGAYEYQMLEHLIPKYYKKGLLREFKSFMHNDRYWVVSGYVLLNDTLRPARDTACFAVTNYYGGRCYSSVVDEQGHFVLGPYQGGTIYAGNLARNKLLVQYCGSETYALTDTTFKPLSPPIKKKIKTILRKHKHARYLVEVPEYTYHPSPKVQAALQKIRQQQRSTDAGFPIYVVERIVDDSSAYIAALEPYRIQYTCDSAGVIRSQSDDNCLLLATDSNLTQGFLDPDGATVYPQLSFHYAGLFPGSHLGITAGNTDPVFLAIDSAGYCGLVNTKNEIVYPEVSFHHREKARLWDGNLIFFPKEQSLVDSLNHALLPGATELLITNATPDRMLAQNTYSITGLYTCAYKSASGQYLQVYIDRNGRVYGKD